MAVVTAAPAPRCCVGHSGHQAVLGGCIREAGSLVRDEADEQVGWHRHHRRRSGVGEPHISGVSEDPTPAPSEGISDRGHKHHRLQEQLERVQLARQDGSASCLPASEGCCSPRLRPGLPWTARPAQFRRHPRRRSGFGHRHLDHPGPRPNRPRCPRPRQSDDHPASPRWWRWPPSPSPAWPRLPSRR